MTRTDAEIGEMLSKWRSDTLKMSPAQVARKAGVAHSVVTRLESGGTVRRATMAKVGAALNLREGWIDEIRTGVPLNDLVADPSEASLVGPPPEDLVRQGLEMDTRLTAANRRTLWRLYRMFVDDGPN